MMLVLLIVKQFRSQSAGTKTQTAPRIIYAIDLTVGDETLGLLFSRDPKGRPLKPKPNPQPLDEEALAGLLSPGGPFAQRFRGYEYREPQIDVLRTRISTSPSSAPGAGGATLAETRIAYMRYAGQGHEITVTLPSRPLAEGDAATLRAAFDTTYATLYGRITKEADFQALFEKRYAGEPFVDVMPPGSAPDTRSVRAANTCRIAVHRPREQSEKRDTVTVLRSPCFIAARPKGFATKTP